MKASLALLVSNKMELGLKSMGCNKEGHFMEVLWVMLCIEKLKSH